MFQLDTDTLDRSWFEAFLAQVTLDRSTGATPGASRALGTLTQRTTADDTGISIAYPSGWQELQVPAGPRSIGVLLGDNTEGVVDAVRLVAQWAPLAAGQTAAEWIADADTAKQDELSCPPSENGAVAIGAHTGVMIDGGCGILGGRVHYRAVAVVGGRGYTFHMDTTILDEASFRILLADVVIDPTAGS